MTHNASDLFISQDEASKIEAETEDRLLKSRKLTLVVDLDQTIIHATVDPTVAQWQNNPSARNHDVLKDVQAFSLPDAGYVPAGHKPTETWYYVKLRPGLREFLENISKLYELHIYTMGTRAYALNVAKIVDPEGKIFGNRVLSRDESGSMTQKDLARLFPKNTKMVVIIDDRGDVWKWSDNLIRVKPYDFFVGIGDINSSFLPKKQEYPTGPTPAALPLVVEPKIVQAAVARELGEAVPDEIMSTDNSTEPTNEDDLTTLEQLVRMGTGDNKVLLEEQAHKLSDAIRVQQELRPLAKQQELLDLQDEKEEARQSESDGSATPSDHGGSKHRHQLIQDENPQELIPLEKNLTKVHRVFFEQYEKNLKSSRGQRRPEDVPDVKDLMNQLKKRTLDGVVLVFSGVIPLQADVHRYTA